MTVTVVRGQLQTKAIVERDSFGQFIATAERAGDDILEELGDKMEWRAKQQAPRRTGRLAASIRAVVTADGRTVRLVSNVPYAAVMEFGSRPHQIHGVRANFRWRGGRFVWNSPSYGPIGSGKQYENWTWSGGATVNHPGTKPHYFFRYAFERTWPEANEVMRRVYRR